MAERQAEPSTAAAGPAAPRVLASTRAVLAGADLGNAMLTVRGELGAPHLGALPELLGRGFASTRLARTVAALEGLHADGRAFGWSLARVPSRESQMAEQALASDVNRWADVLGSEGTGHRGSTVLSLMGPVSLGVELKLPNGEAALSDRGALRDLAASLAAGLEGTLARLRAATDGEPVLLRLVEQELLRAQQARVPTSSGLRRLRALKEHEMLPLLEAVRAQAQELGVPVILDLGGPVPDPSLSRGFEAVAARPRGLGPQAWEALAARAEAGQELFLGLVPLRGAPGAVTGTVRELWQTWRDLGLDAGSLDAVRVEEETDLDGLDPSQARQAMARSAAVAEGLLELSREHG